jgi:putative acetyltransferase
MSKPATFTIHHDDLCGPEIAGLLREHLRDMYATSPPESVHALDLERLRDPSITFWTAWDGHALAGCGALRELDPRHAEIKSMRTSKPYLRSGVGRFVLDHMLNVARTRGYKRVSLETGSMEYFAPARALYENFGFTYCKPFAEYTDDPNSAYMTLQL